MEQFNGRVKKSPSEINVLIADDSAMARKVLSELIGRIPGVRVVGLAQNGLQAVELTQRLKPDLLLLDIVMPVMDGLKALERIMAEQPTPTLLCTALPLENPQEVEKWKALGAIDVIPKPRSDQLLHPESYLQLLETKMKTAVQTPVMPRRRGRSGTKAEAEATPKERLPSAPPEFKVVAIAASTGGPQALQVLLSQLPTSLRVPVLVVQHIATGFAEWFAKTLDTQIPLRVRIAQEELPLSPGEVIIAPDNAHMSVTQDLRIHLDTSSTRKGIRPSADYLFSSLADIYGKNALVVVLTGMGADGAQGAQKIKEKGGYVIVQDQASSAVWGMPGNTAPFADEILPLERISERLSELLGIRRRFP